MNEGLLTGLRSLKEWEQLLEHLNPGDCTAVTEIAEGERPFLAAALYDKTRRPLIIICANELNAQHFANDLIRLFGIESTVLPAREILFSRAAMSRESSWQRLKALYGFASGKTKVLCTTPDAFLDRCPPGERLLAAAVQIAQGDRRDPQKLLDHLLSNGYERVPLVEGQGQCALRGSLLDVYPAGSQEALRIEFFDDEVDSLRTFDCVSQRTITHLTAAVIPPATECLPESFASAAQRFRDALSEEEDTPDPAPQKRRHRTSGGKEPSELQLQTSAEDWLKLSQSPDHAAGLRRQTQNLEVLETGHLFSTAPMWMNVLVPDAVTALRYQPEALILADHPDRFGSAVHSRELEFEDEFSDAWMRGDSFSAQKDWLFDYEALLSDIHGTACFAMCETAGAFGRLNPSFAVTFESTPAPNYAGHPDELIKVLADWKKPENTIVLLTGGDARAQRLSRQLQEAKQPSAVFERLDGNLVRGEIILLPLSCTHGFIHPAAGLYLLSDSELYGTAYQKAKARKKVGESIASFTDLVPGEYVVHELHGIGQYMGVQQLKQDNVTRDYLLIQYAGNDKVYVPTDQFDRVSKYIGTENAVPKLSSLGSGEWQKARGKARAKAKELAFNLAQLYGKRMMTPGYAFSKNNPWQQDFNDRFPYELTEDQLRSFAEIEADMESDRNMDRLLCGDVGFGKTEVALRAAFKALTEGKQVAFLAPTTVLVQQHYNTVKKRFSGFDFRVDMLSRFRTPYQQKKVIQQLESGELDMIIGTHRLLSKDVKFKDLGLLIVDEEQRFGVGHKEAIKNLKTTVDVLTLTATPIPRTLQMSMIHVRDISRLETAPQQRLPVKTYVLEYSDSVIQSAIRRELGRGGQVYFLYNRVKDIEEMHSRLQQLVPEARIAVAHGQMRENALEDIMLDFYAGSYDVLLCTTIVESGLDVPDANTLIVYNSPHFGLSQLYQIRGRVGRSSRQAYAYLTYVNASAISEKADQRLSAIKEFTEFGSGYRIAMRDMEIRGVGNLFGPEQSGDMGVPPIGYEAYLRMIEEAVKEVQGIPLPPDIDTRVELQLDAYLPGDYVSGDKLRVEVYKRIAMIQDEESRLDITEELIDRFGDVPQPVENLMRIAHLRGITRSLGITLVYLKPDGVHMRIDPGAVPTPERFYGAVTRSDARLRFLNLKVPELVLAQRDLTPETALAEAIRVMSRVQKEMSPEAAAAEK